jgi:hypothetical protein
MTEWRKCSHCRRRYLWRQSWPNQLCPRCHRLMEAARGQDLRTDHNTSTPARAGVLEETGEGQIYLPGCGPLQGKL